MSHLLSIKRLLLTAALLLLLALAPAMAQEIVYTGETTTLSVVQNGADNYQWELYSDPSINFAIAPGDQSPTTYAEFVGPDSGSTVHVKWKKPGIYYFKVTAFDVAGCATNMRLGMIKVEKASTNMVLTATKTDAHCFGDKGSIEFTVTNVIAGKYIAKHDNGQFEVAINADGRGTVLAPAGTYNNLILVADNNNSYDPGNKINIEILQPVKIAITETITPINLLTNTKASISLNITGGSGNYTYSWSNGETTKDINNLEKGKYTVTVSDINGCPPVKKDIEVLPPNEPPVAVDDNLIIDCKNYSANVLTNDTDPENDKLFIDEKPVVKPLHGTLILNQDGTFVYHPDPMFKGTDSFKYALFDRNKYPGITATVYLTVIEDFDHDLIPDDVDLDVDGDGIRNEMEVMAGQDYLTADTDGDGLPNYKDIDSDGDGLTDNYEAQSSKPYRAPVIYDANSNGLNDAYEGIQSKFEINPIDIDSDNDNIPDFLDPDSDNDGIPDLIEGDDNDLNGIADHSRVGNDADADGLDDGYDSVVNECNAPDNMRGSYVSMRDLDGDGLPNYRDDNDDDDAYLTKYEDLNGDGDFSNDDFDYDGTPEYLEYGRECELFVPDAFSPNNDGTHDLFQVFCINHYPNAKLYIFDQMGNKLFEKAKYGNEDEWGANGDAWWDGRPDRGKGKGERVAPGTYYYVLDLGNGEVMKSFVFVSY
ncbi:MAG: gliding motility-associated C-terminal domain-containing protein [Methylococcaceae bacterium]